MSVLLYLLVTNEAPLWCYIVTGIYAGLRTIEYIQTVWTYSTVQSVGEVIIDTIAKVGGEKNGHNGNE